jgi:hypothetical protein
MPCLGMVNSYHMFVDIDVGWPSRLYDKSCAVMIFFWQAVHLNSEDGVALADTAWGVGSELVMTPYTVNDGGTDSQEWYNFVHSPTRFFIEETFGRWKNRFRFLLGGLKFKNEHSMRIILATVVLHAFSCSPHSQHSAS